MIIGSTLIHKKTLPSSFDFIKSQSASLSDGSVLLCDHIEHARGRDGRKWQVQEGQLLLTILLKPSRVVTHDTIHALSMALSCGLLESFSEFSAELKWPNDVLISGKKVAGMLIEPVWEGLTLKGISVGIGINLNNHFDHNHELYSSATTLYDYVGKKQDKEVFLKAVFSSLNYWYVFFLEQRDAAIYNRWKLLQGIYNKEISVHFSPEKKIKGIVKQFLPDGSLELFVEGENKAVVIPFYATSSISF